MSRLRSPFVLGVLVAAILLLNLLDGSIAQIVPANLALNPPKVVASSLSTNPGVDLKNIADGDISTMFHSAYPGYVRFGNAYDFTPYVGMELSKLSYISKIVIYNRPNFAYRLQNAEVRVGFNEIISNTSVTTNPLAWKQNAPQGSVIEINLDPPFLGKWISLQNFNPGNQTNDQVWYILNIMDIQVFGVPAALTTTVLGPVCESSWPMILQCPRGTVITQINSAFMGRKDNTTCPSAISSYDTACSAPNFLTAVVSLCLYKSSCAINKLLVPDPCYGTYKYMTASFTCGERLLPSSLVPEVAYFDAMKNVITSPGSNAVSAWSDVDTKARQMNRLNFSSGCQLAQLDSGNAITFSGSCIGKMDSLSSSWSTAADSQFTAVWIGRFNSATAAEQMLMTMSRMPSDTDYELYWSTGASFLYTDTGGFALNQTITSAPTGQWTMEVFSRQQGATRGFVARYGSGSDRMSINSFVSSPSIVLGDNFAVGGDPRDLDKYLNGQVGVLLLYNRSLTTKELMSLATFYAPRFGWPKPSISAVCPAGQVYNSATGACNPCERGSVVYIDGLICTPCPLGLWPDATSRTCTVAADGNSELLAFDVSVNPGNYFEFITDDSGSHAQDDMRVFRPKQGYWFGHTGIEVADYQNVLLPNGTPSLIIRSTKPLDSLANPPLKPPTGWLRKWGVSKGYSIWCPTPPDGYMALGCVFRRSDMTGPEPSEVERLMTLRADLAVAAGGVTKVWFDIGTGASLNGTLWLPTADSASGFSSGAMVGSSKYDANSALAELATARINWVLSSSKVFRTTAPPEGCPAGSAFSISTRSCVTCPAGQVSPGFFGPCVMCASGTQPNVDSSACEGRGRFKLFAKSNFPVDPPELLAFDVSSNPALYFNEMVNDKGSGAHQHVAFFKPTEGLWFGQTAGFGHGMEMPCDPVWEYCNSGFKDEYDGVWLRPGTPAYLFTARNLGGSNPPVKPPADWRKVWATRKCGLFDGPGLRMGLWCPIPPEGYVALGCVFRSTPCTSDYPGDTAKPPPESVDGLVTVRKDLAIPARKIEQIWNDRGSGASLDTAVWRVATSDGDSFASGAMVGSSTHDYNAALQELLKWGLIWTLRSNNVTVLKGPPHASNPGPVDCKSIDAAVEQYAPILKFDSKENYFPSSMDYYLAQSTIGSSIPGTGRSLVDACTEVIDLIQLTTCPNNTISPASKDCATCMKAKFGVDVDAPTTSTLRNFDVTACPSCPTPDKTFLNPRPGSDMSYIYGTRPQPAYNINPPIYTTVVERNRGGIVDIFYQTFYPYNGGKRAIPAWICRYDRTRFGSHYGDFEVVVVRLVFYQGVPFVWQLGGSRHGDIYPYRPVGRITYAQEGHPVMYVLSGGHGIQSFAGKSPSDTSSLATLGVEEYFDGLGAEWQTYKNIETYYSTRSDCTAKGEMSKWWNNYNGSARFGRSAYGLCISTESEVNDGPTAPNTKDPIRNYGDSTYTFPSNF